MLVWSQLGTREAVLRTEQFIYPTLHPIRRQFVAQWLAGVLLALATAGGSLVHWAAAGNLGGIEGISPARSSFRRWRSRAARCPARRGSSKSRTSCFWYIGPMNRTSFDFTQGAYAPGFAASLGRALRYGVGARKLRLLHA